MSTHRLTNFEIAKYYLKNLTFMVPIQKNSLPKIKGRAYVINIDEYKSIKTH